MMPTKSSVLVMALMGSLSLASCGGGGGNEVVSRYEPLSLESAETLTINGYLWQAALDTLAFMTIDSTDASGGVILTDWYINPQAQGERTRIKVTVRDSHLRSDALAVTITRQARNQNNDWVNMPVQQTTVAAIEDAILIQARQIRIRTVVE